MTKTLTQFPTSTAWLLHVSTDIVVFTVRGANLDVLLRQRYSETLGRSDWALPGGYIRPTESLEQCARRTLVQQTGVDGVDLEQLYTFGRPDRHPKSRVITIAYLGLLPGYRADDVIGAPSIGWHAVDNLPPLYLDHADIIASARRHLVTRLGSMQYVFRLVPETFTLRELQLVHETILGQSVDKRNFRKRMLSLQGVEETGQYRRQDSHRPARLYRYKMSSPGG